MIGRKIAQMHSGRSAQCVEKQKDARGMRHGLDRVGAASPPSTPRPGREAQHAPERADEASQMNEWSEKGCPGSTD